MPSRRKSRKVSKRKTSKSRKNFRSKSRKIRPSLERRNKGLQTTTMSIRSRLRSLNKRGTDRVEDVLVLEPSNTSVRKFDKCYVWLLMRGDDYTPGVYTSVHSINRTRACKDSLDLESNINTVVMVTNDVSENAIRELKKVCDYIVRVDYIQHPTKSLRTERQRNLYSSWNDVSYTKWQMLKLPFKKAIFLDSDIIIIDNIDHLFNLKAPAGVFSSPVAYPSGKLINYYVNSNIVGDDGYAKHGSIITKSMIKNAMLNNKIEKRTTSVTATSILLEPNVEDFNKYINMLKTEFKKEFGFTGNIGADEQSITYYYSLYNKGPKLDWINIHHRYNFLSWKTENFLNNEMPYIIHFLSQPKPWKLNVNEYNDLVNWYIMFLDGVKGDTTFFKNVISNISTTEKDVDKLKEICLNMDQSYIRSLSSKFKKVNSCLDILCTLL